MAYFPPPFWGNRNNSGMPSAFPGQGSYQAARPGANMPASSQSKQRPATALPSNAAPVGIPHPAQPQQRPADPPPLNPSPNPAQATANHAAQQAYQAAPQNQAPAPSANSDYISQKIYKIHGKNKVVDFNSKLTKAYLTDFANIHGSGGAGHASNSTIGLTICDSTNGTGENSVTVKYAIDVEDISIFYEAAMAARLGTLRPNLSVQTQWLNSVTHLLDSWKQIPPDQNGARLIPRQALNALHGILQNANSSISTTVGVPIFSYTREKNNPYKIGEQGFAPCSKVTISYSPYRKDGQPSSYPWYIGIENIDAPVSKQANGAVSHNSKMARNKKSAFINLSLDDFAAAMVAIRRFVDLWEQVNMGPVLAEAYRRIDAAKANNTERR